MSKLYVKLFSYLAMAVVAVVAYHLYIAAGGADWQSTRIDAGGARFLALVRQFEHSWQRQPDPQEMRELSKRYVREEMAFREGIRSGLGSDDITVRRRVQELLEDKVRTEATSDEPTQSALQAFLTANPDPFRVDALTSFRHIFFESDDNAIGADAAARFMLGTLQNQEMPEDLAKLGDPSRIPLIIENVTKSDLADLMGDEFVTALAAIEVGSWGGPLRSRFGVHIVHVDARSTGRLPSLDDIVDKVRELYLKQLADEAVERLYEDLSRKYDVRG